MFGVFLDACIKLYYSGCILSIYIVNKVHFLALFLKDWHCLLKLLFQIYGFNLVDIDSKCKTFFLVNELDTSLPRSDKDDKLRSSFIHQ